MRAFADWVVELFGGCPLLNGCDSEVDYDGVRTQGSKTSGNALREVLEQNNLAESTFSLKRNVKD